MVRMMEQMRYLTLLSRRSFSTKVSKSASPLKTLHRQNKELFGPLIESSVVRTRRLKKESKAASTGVPQESGLPLALVGSGTGSARKELNDARLAELQWNMKNSSKTKLFSNGFHTSASLSSDDKPTPKPVDDIKGLPQHTMSGSASDLIANLKQKNQELSVKAHAEGRPDMPYVAKGVKPPPGEGEETPKEGAAVGGCGLELARPLEKPKAHVFEQTVQDTLDCLDPFKNPDPKTQQKIYADKINKSIRDYHEKTRPRGFAINGGNLPDSFFEKQTKYAFQEEATPKVQEEEKSKKAEEEKPKKEETQAGEEPATFTEDHSQNPYEPIFTEDHMLLLGTEGLSAEMLMNAPFPINPSFDDYVDSLAKYASPIYNRERDGVYEYKTNYGSIVSIPFDKKPSGGRVPSVSTILNKTMPPEQATALAKWEKNMIAKLGVEGFRVYKEDLFAKGKEVHKNIESVLSGTPIEKITVPEPISGFWKSLTAIIPDVSSVRALESTVVHPTLNYCGIIDCVALYKNKLVLIDWKTSEKPKPFISKTYDAPIQISSYIGAINHDPNYSIHVKEGLVVVLYKDGKQPHVFEISEEEVVKYWGMFLQRLEKYEALTEDSGEQDQAKRSVA